MKVLAHISLLALGSGASASAVQADSFDPKSETQTQRVQRIANEQRSLAEERRLSITYPRQTMAYLHGRMGPPILVEWQFWEKLSPRDRVRLLRGAEQGSASQISRRLGFQVWQPVAYGFVQFTNDWGCCPDYRTSVDRRRFTIFNEGMLPKQADGSEVMKTYGFKLPPVQYGQHDFLVFEYTACGFGSEDNGQCYPVWWRRLIDWWGTDNRKVDLTIDHGDK